MNKWQLYEKLKKQIKTTDPAEYEKEIAKIQKRLKI